MRSLFALLLAAGSAYAASLVRVNDFGSNPTNIKMYEYVPSTIKEPRSLVVVIHFCTGSASAMMGYEFDEHADKHGYVQIYPETSRSGSCWDVSTSKSLTRDGGSDNVGIMSMVKYAIEKHNIDKSRVFVTGASSGAMMTNVLLAEYPDVFAAGAPFMGVPYTCFQTEGGGNPAGSQSAGWNNACANGQVSKSAQEWGDIARNGYPGYTGRKPRVQLWHGSSDTTLNFRNFAEEVKMWTNYHGVSQTPTSQDSPSGWQRAKYGDMVEAITVNGVGHNLPQNGQVALMVSFFGLDGTPVPGAVSSPSPEPMPPVATGDCKAKLMQCGGKTYTGPTCCEAGSTCKVISEWYSQCN